MSSIDLFNFIGDDNNRSSSPPKNILKRQGKKLKSQQGQRYWPGKAPEYAQDVESSSDEELEDEKEAPPIEAVAAQVSLEQDRRFVRFSGDVKPINRSRSRLQALKASQEPISDTTLEVKPQPQDTSNIVKQLDRSAIRAKALEYRKNEERCISSQSSIAPAINVQPEQDEEGEPEEESSDDSDYMEEARTSESPGVVLEKPLFVPKLYRATVHEKIDMERENKIRQQYERERLKQRQAESKRLLVDTLTREKQEEKRQQPIDVVDDTDDPNDVREYELWKIRELKRLLRDKEERTAHEELMKQVERRRNMTPEELERDNAELDAKKVQQQPRSKMRFLQKYYHKGAFFMDKLHDGSEPVYNRDFNAPTADDLIDRTALPKPMQVRRGLYGKHGQVKHTHLADVDTTSKDTPWAQAASNKKRSDFDDGFSRPSKRKKAD